MNEVKFNEQMKKICDLMDGAVEKLNALKAEPPIDMVQYSNELLAIDYLLMEKNK